MRFRLNDHESLLLLEPRVRGISPVALALFALVSLWFAGADVAAQSLDVSYGAKGVQRIAYAGVVLEDVGANPGDAFHIWHTKATSVGGRLLPGWGESNLGETWDGPTHTETYTFAWGTISTQFVQTGTKLDMIVTERNNPDSGIVFDGAEIYPFTLHFPQDPVGFSGYTQFVPTTTGPGVSVADFGAGVVTSVIPDESVGMYGGWKNAGANAYSPLMTTTAPDGLPSFLPRLDRPVAPGSSFSYTVSLRFTPPGTPAGAADAYASFAATYPSQMTWSDRRILGTAYLASAPQGSSDSSQPGGFPTNPRRYFNDPSVDVTTTAGLRAFQNRILAQAAANVRNTQAMNGQGVITWDIEGEQYPHSTTYVCSPDQIASVAPEMESTVVDSASGYFGQKLDDAYFRIMTSAGLKAGVCIRPQVFALAGNNTASQSYLNSNAAIIANLENKARFANSRWGVTIFYVDSTVDVNGGTLDPTIFQQLITDLPSFLFIPEESTPRYYAYSAPFYSFIFHTDLGTPAAIYNVYPRAFGANLVNDVSPATLATYQPQLTKAVAKGDILMGHADYWQANDPTLVSIYQAAGSGAPAPVQTTPSISWVQPGSIGYGTALSETQLNAVASTAGSFTYAPPAGTVLKAGNNLLTVTFTPADTTAYTSSTASVPIVVTQAASAIHWGMPASVAAGTMLGPAQLNATSDVAGTFTYSPAAGTVLVAGVTTLNTSFLPADATDYLPGSASTSINVSAAAAATPVISWPTPASIIYGTVLGGAQLNATANVNGSFSYTPAAGTLPGAGISTLSALFIPADTTSYSTVTATNVLTVGRATPVLNWPAPAAITAGTALSSVQLNATANIPGSFSYNPGAGSVPGAGNQTLNVTFTPADQADYTTVSASNILNVTAPVVQPPPSDSRLALISPAPGSVISGQVTAAALCRITLDAAGTSLMVDGVLVGRRVAEGPFFYQLDTRGLSNGPHTLQIWAHDIGNNTTISDAVGVVISN